MKPGRCVCESLWGVTSKCRDPRQRVPRGVPVVWSLHISRIPRYAGLITLASSAAPWLPLCTDSCWPPLTNILLLVLQSTFPFFCLLFHPSFTPCVCVCVSMSVFLQLWFWPELSFRQDTERHRGGGGICLPLIGMCYWLTFTGAGPDPHPPPTTTPYPLPLRAKTDMEVDHLSLCQEEEETRLSSVCTGCSELQ